MNVNAVNPSTSPILAPEGIKSITSAPVGTGNFGKFISDALQSVESAQQTAHASVESFMRGETQEIHKVALDQQRAAISFEFLLQVRNKIVSAYQEVMKMQM